MFLLAGIRRCRDYQVGMSTENELLHQRLKRRVFVSAQA